MKFKNKRAQATIFIIIAIVIVAIIALFFVFRDKVGINVGKPNTENPSAFLESCIKDKSLEAIDLISRQGGSVNPSLYSNFKFTDEESADKIGYLCYTSNNYEPCINQHPVFISYVENEIKNYIEPDVESCFYELVSKFEKQNYVVVKKYNDFEVELFADKMNLNIDGELSLTKSGANTKYNDFRVTIPTSLYNLLMVSEDIVTQEVQQCNFDLAKYSLIYPEFDVEKARATNSSIIYRIRLEGSVDKFKFAIRGCVFPT